MQQINTRCSKVFQIIWQLSPLLNNTEMTVETNSSTESSHQLWHQRQTRTLQSRTIRKITPPQKMCQAYHGSKPERQIKK